MNAGGASPLLLADLNLVIALLKDDDALKARAEAFASQHHERLVVTAAVGLELLLWCRKYGQPPVDVLAACMSRFEVESHDVLLTAAHALQKGDVSTPFDAFHLAEALHRGTHLVTADEELVRSRYPTTPF